MSEGDGGLTGNVGKGTDIEFGDLILEHVGFGSPEHGMGEFGVFDVVGDKGAGGWLVEGQDVGGKIEIEGVVRCIIKDYFEI